MAYLLLLDAAPEPISAGLGIAGLVFVAIVVLMITAAVLLGAVFLFRAIRKSSARSARVAGGQHQTNPNQP
jgi:hypothetical protein